MNPTSLILRNNNFLGRGIVTIASKSGEGKTLLCNSMLYHFLESGINVIMFSEGVIRKIRPTKKGFKAIAILSENFGTYDNTVDRFNKVLNHNIPFLKGQTVVILDSPLFLTHNSESMVYDKIKCENTRRVLFEKINSNKIISYTKSYNSYESARRNIESLQELSRKFNMSIITTTQLNRTSSRHSVENVNTHLAMHSNLIITSEKRSSSFEAISFLSLRYSATSVIKFLGKGCNCSEYLSFLAAS